MRGFLDQVFHDRAAFAPEHAVARELERISRVSDNQAAKPPVTYQNVGTKAKDEVVQIQLPRNAHRLRKLIRRSRFIKKVRRAANLERGERGERDATGYTIPAKCVIESGDCVGH